MSSKSSKIAQDKALYKENKNSTGLSANGSASGSGTKVNQAGGTLASAVKNNTTSGKTVVTGTSTEAPSWVLPSQFNNTNNTTEQKTDANGLIPATALPGELTVGNANPYMQAAYEATQGYRDAYKERLKALNAAAASQNDSTNTAYNASAKNTYGNYLEALKRQKENASSNGMTGGAVERMRVDTENNYNRGYAANEGGRARALAAIQAQLNSDSANAAFDYQNQYTSTMLQGRTAAQQAADQKAADKAARDLQQTQFKAQQDLEKQKLDFEISNAKINRYIETISSFTKKSQVDKEIKRVQKSKAYTDAEKDEIIETLKKYKKTLKKK